ncbi:conserved protein of unknown function [Candidatus Nitrosocosmicus franklandus]|uniref:Uncharacterized protein n=1 Tax=Candidatus Nitrosocosmicus franklandianus TaxID=1798806 RepID=A0A484IDF3_9ARCH|nr:conserved protein of unknown function [Candidatus Nitrosocosmicus franklandus]
MILIRESKNDNRFFINKFGENKFLMERGLAKTIVIMSSSRNIT